MRGRPRFDTAGAGSDVRTRRLGQGVSLGEARPRTHPGVPQREGRVDRDAYRRVPKPGRARLRPLGPAGTAPVQSRFQTNRPLEGLQRSCRRLPVRRHLRALAGARKGNQMSNHSHEETGSGRMTSAYAARIRAIEALLLEKGVLTEPEVQDSIAYMEARSRPTAPSSWPAPGWTRISRSCCSPTVRPRPRNSTWTPSTPPSSSSWRIRLRCTT